MTGAAVGTARAGGVRRRLLVPFGTRPEVVKLAPVVRALRAAGHRVRAVHIGQHDDPAMAADVPRSLELAPDVQLRLAGGVAARRGALLSGAVDAIAADRPDLVLTLGDTETVPAYALAARAAGVAFGHLEAGLRSFNQRSVEELNRRIATASAQLHFAPTARSAALLAAEGVPAERVFVVGNPVVDALRERGLAPVPPDRRTGVLVTAHRPTNVDDPTRLARLVALVEALSVQVGPVRFPVHPRTARRLDSSGLGARLSRLDSVTMCGPLPYDGMLGALAGCRVAVTDSGGIQEEAAFFGVPVVVLRRSTPRWEGVENGSAVLAGLTFDEDADRALRAAQALTAPPELARVAALPCPYGDGTTGARVAATLSDPGTGGLLDLVEPDFTDGPRPWSAG